MAGSSSRSISLAVNVPPQVAPVTIGDEPANWGEQVSATCNVLKGDSPIEIGWTLNGETISPRTHPDINISKNGKKISLLVIDSVTGHHAGEYACIAANLAGSSSRSAILAVNVAPQIMAFSFGDRPANSGESMLATCSVSAGDFPMEFVWFFNGKQLTVPETDEISLSTNKRRSWLEIDAVKAQHAGTYTCTVSNEAGATSHSTVLIVNVAPQIAPFSFGDRPVNHGESMSATCAVTVGDNPLEFSWYFNGQLIDSQGKPEISISINKRRSTLDIESVNAEHSGEYTCSVSNLAGATTHSTSLIVNVAPLIGSFSFGEDPLNAGDATSLTCSVTKGDSPLEIVWMFNSQILSMVHQDVIVSETGKRTKQLTIDSVSARHAGEYTCIASNTAGSSSRSAILTVNVSPQIVPFMLGDGPVNSGESMSTICTVSRGDYPMEFSWFFNGEKIMAGLRDDLTISVTKRRSVLEIEAVSASHAGEYTCSVSNEAGANSHTAALIVNVPPRVGPVSIGEESVNEGQKVIITCYLLRGDYPIEIFWTLNGEPIKSDTHPDVTIATPGETDSLVVINSVSAHHAGEYTCNAENQAGLSSSSARLAVNVAPQILPFSFGDRPANSGESMSATCTVSSGDFPLEISWFFNGEQLIVSDAQDVSVTGSKRRSILEIEAVAAHHAGTYTCLVSNEAGAVSHNAVLVVNVAPQIVPFSFSDRPVNYGDSMSAMCAVSVGDNPLKFSWYFNGQTLNLDDRQDISVSISKRKSAIDIESVQASHSGEYTCEVSNQAGAVSHTTALLVNVAPQIGIFSFGDEPLNAGDTASLTCIVIKGDSPLEIEWMLNGQPIDAGQFDITVSETGKKTKQLTIDSVNARHAGEYTCIASNLAGSTSRSAVLIVNGLTDIFIFFQQIVGPQIVPFSFSDRPVNSGDSMSATCAVSVGDNPLQFTWYFNDQLLNLDDRQDISVSISKRKSSLDIEAVQASHSGEYTCEVSNQAGAISHSTALIVNVAPQIGVFSFGDEPLNAGDTASLSCIVMKGDSPLEIEWMLNGQSIDPIQLDITVSESGKRTKQLTIDSVNARHAGEYTCIASNQAGSTTRSATLTVNVPPFVAPFIIGEDPANWGEQVSATCTVLKGDRPVKITWTLNNKLITPQTNPDISITRSGKMISLLSIDSVSAHHTGQYTCIAKNAAGVSERSAVLTVNVAPQIGVGFSFGEEPLNAGDMATITCAVIKGDSPLGIEIMFKGNPIDVSTSGVVISDSGKRAKQLMIESVEAKHVGEYTCVASNNAGSTSRSTILAVNVPPQIAPFAIEEGPVNWGEQVSLICSVLKGDRPMKIHWSLNDNPISPKSHGDISISKTGKMISVLSIDSVAAHHAGNYTCIASNHAGAAYLSTRLSVNVSPQIGMFSFGQEPLNAGEMATVQCAVIKGDFPVDIVFMFGNNIVLSGHHDIVISESGKRAKQLTIESVGAKHAGEYTCIASNAAGSTSRTANLAVNGTLEEIVKEFHVVITSADYLIPVPPQIAPFTISEEPANWGDQVSAVCNVMKGDLPIDISWTFNGEPINLDTHPSISVSKTKKNSLLNIDSVSGYHAGEYTCVASNLVGSSTRSAILAVNVAPQIGMFSFGEEPLNAGDTTSVQCVIMKGDTPLDISFTFQGIPIVPGRDVIISETGKRAKQLMIDSVNAKHAGEYTCIASNMAGATSRSALLSVNVLPQIGPISIGDEPANWGEQVSSMCSILKGDEPIKIRWTLNGELINSKSHPDITISKSGKKLSVLNIDSATADHAGVYTCIASNHAGISNRSAILSVNVAPQIAPFSFGEEPVNAGDMASVQCAITKGDFPLKITWLFQDKPIDPSKMEVNMLDIGKRTKQLMIESVRAKHAGKYTCIAENVAGSTALSAVLNVNVAPQIGVFTFGDEPLNAGDIASVTCAVTKGDLPMEINWMFQNEVINEKLNDIDISNLGKRGKQLSIEAVRANHAGEYTCVASNIAGSTTRSAVLNVNVAPQIGAFTFGEEPVNAGDVASVTCVVTKGDFPMDIHWLFKNEPIDDNFDGITISSSGKRGKQLNIEAVSARHAGEYTCVASNIAGATTRTAVLDVNVTPQVGPFTFGNEPVNAGDVVSVLCIVTKGDFPMEISWMFKDRPLDESSHDVIVSESGKRGKQLTIESAQAKHAGEYTCAASNIAGTVTRTATLDVNVTPKLLPFTVGSGPLNSGQVVIVPCATIEGDQPLSLRWTHNGHEISPHSGISILDLGERGAILSIGSVQASHAGTYTCTAENMAGKHQLSSDLIVNVAPHLQPFSFHESTNTGDLIIVHCAVVKGDAPLSLKWLFNGRHIEMGDDQIQIASMGERVSTLTIPAVRGEHAGEYACVADSLAGRVTHSAHLKVNGTTVAAILCSTI
ncbi:hypothetical protein QAD02_009584 [Eretmocerus hayati]|uniref:Uncharacterized protein n=1 Tax=Eretmocerus hayati TaxID=131215 RepID=A0ACC2NAI0_9HYME|nr:hypothetical protein QAD02_009584 [Eretmocerus hayati]